MACLNTSEAAQLYVNERESFNQALQIELDQILHPNTEIANLPTNYLGITDEGLLDAYTFRSPEYLRIGKAQSESINSLSQLINTTTFANWGRVYMDPDQNNLNAIPTRSGAPTSPYEEPLSRGVSGTDLLEIALQPFIHTDTHIQPDSQRVEELSRIHMRSIFYITKSILTRIEKGEEEDKIHSAKIALYALVPVMRTLEIPILIEALEDAAFKTLDPNGFKLGVEFWNSNVRKIDLKTNNDEPIRFSQEEMHEHEAYLKRIIINSTGIPENAVKVEGRQKSIFALTKKIIAGRSPRDAVAFTVSIDEKHLPKNLSQHGINGFGDYVSNIIIRNLNNNGVRVDVEANTFSEPLKRNPNYKIVDLMIDDPAWDIDLATEVRISLESCVEDNKRDHPWYKIAMRNADSALERSGYSTKAFYYLGDWAQYTHSIASGNLDSSVRFQETSEQMNFLIQLFRSKITLSTIRGGLTLHVDEIIPSRQNLLPKARAIAQTLEGFTMLIEPNILRRVGGYIIRRVEMTEGGKQEEVYYRVKIENNRVKRVDRGERRNKGTTFGKMSVLIGDFDLKNGDTISIMIQGEDRQYREFLTINEFMELLSEPITPQVKLRLDTRYISYTDELLRWKESLNSLVQDIFEVGSQRKEHKNALASIRREIRASILAYELYEGVESFMSYFGLQKDKRITTQIARKNRYILFRYIKRLTPSHKISAIKNQDAFKYGKAFRYNISNFLVQNPIALRALAHNKSSDIHLSYQSFLDSQHNKSWNFLIDCFLKWEPEFGYKTLQIMREITLSHLSHLCSANGQDIVHIESNLIRSRGNGRSRFPYAPKPRETPKPTRDQFIRMGLPIICEKLAIPWKSWFNENEEKGLISDYLIRHRGEQLDPNTITKLLVEYQNMTTAQRNLIQEESIREDHGILEIVEQRLHKRQHSIERQNPALVQVVLRLVKEISQTFDAEKAPHTIIYPNGDGAFRVQKRIGYRQEHMQIAPFLPTSPPQ